MKFYTLLFLILSLLGCTKGLMVWDYHPNEYYNTKHKIKTLDVVVFSDERSSQNAYDNTTIAMIPLIPIGTYLNPMPEINNHFRTKSQHLPIGDCNRQMNASNYKYFIPSIDFAAAMISEINATNYVNEYNVNFLCNRSQSKADYRIEGKIIEASMSGSIYTYGLSVFAIFPAILGIPTGKDTFNLKLHLSLISNKTQEKILSKTYTTQPITIINSTFSQKNGVFYDQMTTEIYKKFINDIKDKIK